MKNSSFHFGKGEVGANRACVLSSVTVGENAFFLLTAESRDASKQISCLGGVHYFRHWLVIRPLWLKAVLILQKVTGGRKLQLQWLEMSRIEMGWVEQSKS